MVIYTIHSFDEKKLVEVMQVAKEIGSVTLNAFFNGEAYHMLEGVHRIEAAKRLGIPLIIVCKELDDVIPTDCEDCNGFDPITRTAKVFDIMDYAYSDYRDTGIYTDKDFVSVEIH